MHTLDLLFFKRFIYRVIKVGAACALALSTAPAAAEQSIGAVLPANAIIGQSASDEVGNGGVVELPSGNLVIISKTWDGGKGAVTCLTPVEYQAGNIVVSAGNSLVGSNNGDNVGSGGVVVLTNGNFLVHSPSWDASPSFNQGAVTWVDGVSCTPAREITRNAAVSADNSLVGTTNNDQVGNQKSLALSNGDYVVYASNWDIPSGAVDVGAVTWGEGENGSVSPVSASTSLIGSSASDMIGSGGVYEVGSSDFIVLSPMWNHGATADVGAVTRCDGDGDCMMTVSSANSLIGSTASDKVGSFLPEVLPSGDYVISSPDWDNGATANVGAATWLDGASPTTGVVSISNSLIGSTADDMVSGGRIETVGAGNYVVSSPNWHNGTFDNVGAVTWCSGTSPCSGTISAANSLVGDSTDDLVGFIKVLTDGDYLVQSLYWHSNRGAVTWADGDSGIVGIVSAANSLVGSTVDDTVGSIGKVTELANGHYVVATPFWDDGPTVNVGAVTWCSGTGGCTGLVSTSNSLTGDTANDNVGSSVIALTNGHYVVDSPSWDNGATLNVGAVTWRDGTAASFGLVSAANSMIGASAHDSFGSPATVALPNGNYVSLGNNWDDGATPNAGAVVWCDGVTGCLGTVSASTALVGSTAHDSIGIAVDVLPNGNYVVRMPSWDNGVTADVGASVWGDGIVGLTGAISPSNALIGTSLNDRIGQQLAVLDNGDYVLTHAYWNANRAAVTFVDGETGLIGQVDGTNSLIGVNVNDLYNSANLAVTPLSNGGFVAAFPSWDNGATTNIGAVVYSSSGADPVAVNLLQNGSFETAGTTPKKADAWTVKNPKGADRRLCHTDLKPVTTTDGLCVFQFNSTLIPEKARSLKQILTTGDLGVEGQTLSFSAMVEAKKLKTGAKIIVTVTYLDNTTAKFNVALTKGTYAFTERTGSMVLTKTVQKIVVNVNVAKVTGRVRLDDLWLTVGSSVRLPFPSHSAVRDGAALDLPDVPEGFRQ